MINDMQFYLLILGALLLVFIQKPDAVILYFSFCLLIIFASLNLHLSIDYYGYIEYFKCSTSDSCSEMLRQRVESSYIYTSRVVSALGGDGYFVIFCYIFISIIIKLFLIGKSAHFGMALFAYVVFGFFIHEMTQIRVGLAIAFIWLAVLFSVRKRMAVSLLSMTMAFVVHNSSVVAFIYFIIKNLKLNLHVVVALFMLAALSGYLMLGANVLAYIGVSDPRFNTYLAASSESLLKTPQFTVNVVIYMSVISLAYYFRGKDRYDDFSEASLKLSTFGVLIYLAFYWMPVVGLRVMELFTSFMPFVFAAVYKRSKSAGVKFVFVVLAIFMFFNLFVRNISPFSEENEPVPFNITQWRISSTYG